MIVAGKGPFLSAMCDLHDYSHQCFSWVSTFSALDVPNCSRWHESSGRAPGAGRQPRRVRASLLHKGLGFRV